MEQIRRQKTLKYTGNLSTKLPFLQNDENALTTFLHSTDDIFAIKFISVSMKTLNKWVCGGCVHASITSIS